MRAEFPRGHVRGQWRRRLLVFEKRTKEMYEEQLKEHTILVLATQTHNSRGLYQLHD